MSLNDRAADRQPDAHAAALRRIEGIKDLVHALTVKAHAGILDGHSHAFTVFPLGSDQQLARAIIAPTIASEALRSRFMMTCWSWTRSPVTHREVVGELRPKNHPISLKVTQRQRDDLSRRLVQIQRLERELLLAEQGT